MFTIGRQVSVNIKPIQDKTGVIRDISSAYGRGQYIIGIEYGNEIPQNEYTSIWNLKFPHKIGRGLYITNDKVS